MADDRVKAETKEQPFPYESPQLPFAEIIISTINRTPKKWRLKEP